MPSAAIATAGMEDLMPPDVTGVANFCAQLEPLSNDSVTTNPSSPESIDAPGAVP